MAAPFPHEYRASLNWIGERSATLSAAEQPMILGGPPPQFDGSPTLWSPEELLLSSVQLCLMTTFFSLAMKRRVEVSSYKSEIIGILAKTADGIRFTKIALKVDLKSKTSPEEAKEMLRTAKKYCIISGALNVQVELIGDDDSG